MKTIQELYSEIMASQELKAQLIEAAKAGKQEEFLKAHGCEANPQEIAAFLFDELENAAGGACMTPHEKQITISACTLGLGCGAVAIASLVGDAVQETNYDPGLLCDL